MKKNKDNDKNTRKGDESSTLEVSQQEGLGMVDKGNEFLGGAYPDYYSGNDSKDYMTAQCNMNLKKEIFGFGEEKPNLVVRYQKFNPITEFNKVRTELSVGPSSYRRLNSNPFILTLQEYENLNAKLSFGHDNTSAIDLFNRLSPVFISEVFGISSLAFGKMSSEKESEAENKQRLNSMKVLVLIALARACNDYELDELIDSSALSNTVFMATFNAVQFLIVHLRTIKTNNTINA